MYKLFLTKTAEKDLKRIDERYQVAINNRFENLKENPFIGKRLKDNLKEFWSLREGVYRIIYTVNKNDITVIIVTIGHRQGVYK